MLYRKSVFYIDHTHNHTPLIQRADSTLDDDDLHSLQQLEQKITQLCLLQGEQVEELTQAANSVLYHLSGLHFHGIFNKIILR